MKECCFDGHIFHMENLVLWENSCIKMRATLPLHTENIVSKRFKERAYDQNQIKRKERLMRLKRIVIIV